MTNPTVTHYRNYGIRTTGRKPGWLQWDGGFSQGTGLPYEAWTASRMMAEWILSGMPGRELRVARITVSRRNKPERFRR